ncbi:MAG: methyltransferase domain-containing protein [Clostridiales bacterium]|nr:methyltransferase domain-containing protein [Clostridiales bacterium]MCF8021189.1 methyltransferase domain-containing protein [Clostridiales bacterium]
MNTFKFWKGKSPRAVNIAQDFLGEIIEHKDAAIDATAGNGNDTLYLAEHVGPGGTVYAFDIQEYSINQTASCLEKAGLDQRAVLISCGHENMESILINEYSCRSCKAAIFNLGYLPGSDKCVKTNSETTISAVNQALSLLVPGGRLSVVVYRGHDGAEEESREVNDLILNLDPKKYWAASINFPNRDLQSPYVILVQKTVGV